MSAKTPAQSITRPAQPQRGGSHPRWPELKPQIAGLVADRNPEVRKNARRVLDIQGALGSC